MLMDRHAPENYVCPICLGVEGVEDERTLIRGGDIIFRDQVLMVFVASYFIKTCEGHLIVVPLMHYENLYELPDEVGARIMAKAREMAVVMKRVYGCDGVTILQNNEPASGQHAFHYHMHLFPRYAGDELYRYMMDKRETTTEERRDYTKKLKSALELSK